MRSTKPLSFLLCLSLVAFVGGPLETAYAKSKGKSHGHGKSDHGNGKDDDRGDDDGDRDGEDGPRNEFALFDGSNPLNQPDAGAICGASKGRPYTYHLALANYGSDGFVRVTYFDGDWVQYPIAAGGSLSLSQAAGSKGGDDRVVRVSNGGSAAQLAGVLSAENGKCASCDADGGIGDAGCDAFVGN
jgi:hypothetical protein